MGKEKIQNRLVARPVSIPERILLAVERGVARVYERHRLRYHAWDQAGYRFFTQFAAMLAIAALLGTVGWVGWKACRKHQELQASEQSIECLARGDYPGAWRDANRALALNRADAQASRVLAEVASLTRRPEELTLWQRVAMLAPTTENQLAVAGASLRCQNPPYSQAGEILGQLAGIGATNACYQEIAARLALSQGQPAEAQAHLASACRLDPANRQYGLNLAILQLNSAAGAGGAAARQRVESYTKDVRLKPVALRALVKAALAAGDLAAAQGYSTRLTALPEATLNDRLRDLEILQRLKSESFPAALAALQKQAESGPDSIAEVGEWLLAHGLAARNIDWLTSLPYDFLARRPRVESALARSYLQNTNWQAALDFTSHGDWGDLDFLRLAVISRAWSELGMATLAESNWGGALTKAGDNFEALTNLMALAQQWQWQSEAADLRLRVRQLGRPDLASDFDVDTLEAP